MNLIKIDGVADGIPYVKPAASFWLYYTELIIFKYRKDSRKSKLSFTSCVGNYKRKRCAKITVYFCRAGFVFRNMKSHYFSTISQLLDGADICNPLWNTHFIYTVIKSMVANGLVTNGTMSSARMALSYFAWNTLVSASGGRLNKTDGLTRYGNSHVKDKTS